MASGSIFICYRREDTIAYAGRLYDRLSSHFGTNRVFMDVDAIQPGEDFVEVLEQVTGKVTGVRVLRSIPLLDPAAIEAVTQWEFTPTMLNGVGVPVIMTVTVNFALADDRAVVSKFVDRLQAAGNTAAALDMLRKVFAVNAWGSSDAAIFSTLRTNVASATEAQLQLAKSFIPKD